MPTDACTVRQGGEALKKVCLCPYSNTGWAWEDSEGGCSCISAPAPQSIKAAPGKDADGKNE